MKKRRDYWRFFIILVIVISTIFLLMKIQKEVKFGPGNPLPIRGGYNSASMLQENLDKYQRQIEDGYQDIIVKFVEFKVPYNPSSQQDLFFTYDKIEEFGGEAFWPVFNFNTVKEIQWYSSLTDSEGNSIHIPYVNSSGYIFNDASCITPEFWRKAVTDRFKYLATLSSTQYPLIKGAIID